ncbi:MAG: PspA/IM30 family protein, partial [Elusimicrobia bacterium]|nr:PspA/IM30 family protein [Elusimicrobiota bacterium]
TVEKAQESANDSGAGIKNILIRLWNVLMGWAGLAIRAAENPEVMLRQYLDELKAAEPKYNQMVARAEQLKASLETQIAQDEKDVKVNHDMAVEALRLAKEVRGTGDEQAALAYENEAENYISMKKVEEASLETNHQQYALAVESVAQVQKERDEWFKNKEREIQVVMAKIGEHKRAKAMQELAEMKVSFKQGDRTGQLKDMKDNAFAKIDEETAEAKGKLRSAETSPEEKMNLIRKKVEERGVKEELEKLKREVEGTK